jgi:DNA-binding beta-propeller fold protein YncE
VLPDPIEGKTVKKILLGKKPRFVASRAGRSYVTSKKGQISVLDIERGAVVEEWTIPGAEELTGVAVYGNYLFVADFNNHCIRVLNTEGKQERRIGNRGSGNGQLTHPQGVAIAGELLYVCDSNNSRVQVFKLDGTWVRSWGSKGAGQGQFDLPTGITVQDDEVYVADYRNHRVQVFTLDGGFRRTLGSTGTGAGELKTPYGVIVHEERVYVTDIGNTCVKSFSVVDGGFVNSFSNGLLWPMGLCVDDKDRLLVCDNFSFLMVFR